MARWKKRPEGSNWGDFGEDDNVGRLNLITPERRLEAMREVKEGISFTLSLPLDFPGGAEIHGGLRQPPKRFASIMGNIKLFDAGMRSTYQGCKDLACDDGLIIYTQYSTQWDSLAHLGQYFDADDDGVAEKVYYNGYRGGIELLEADQAGEPNAKALGLEHMAAHGAQGRGVLVNFHEIYGTAHQPIGYAELMDAFKKQHVEVRPGDFLLAYSGFDDMLLQMNKSPDVPKLRRHGAVLDGGDKRLLQWITDSGIAAICSDTPAVESVGRFFADMPKQADEFTMLPLHEHCLFKLGIHLGEFWLLRDLAAWLQLHRRTAFLLTAPPLRMPGTVGSPVTPVATV